MIEIRVKIDNLDRLARNVGKVPARSIRHLARATTATLLEVEKQAVDRNFQFKMPRSMRTGMLQRSFAFGRYIHPSGLYASIGPTVHYAPYVYFGTRKGRPNFFMDRIARAAEPYASEHFQKAVDKIIDEI